MFDKLKNLLNQQEPQPQQQSPMQARMMQVVEQYAEAIPFHLRPMLSGVLHGLGDKMNDENIMTFVTQTRSLLDFVENGALPFTEGDEHGGADKE